MLANSRHGGNYLLLIKNFQMPRVVLFIIFVFLGCKISAQDLIVTTDNDSINAKITKDNKKGIYFDFMKDNELRSTLLLRSQISSSQKNFFEAAEIPDNLKRSSSYEGERFRLAVEAGFGYRLGRIEGDFDNEVREYLRSLKSGFHWGASAHYYLVETACCRC